MADNNLHHALDAAIKSKLVPCQEYFLQGSILDDHVNGLLAILKGLCDDCEGPMESFQDHEMCFVIMRPLEQPMRLRVRRSLDHQEQPHLVRYIGITEAGDWSQLTAVRTSIDVGTSENIVAFLQLLGYWKEFEFVSRGFVFKKGRMKVTVSKINKAKELEHALSVLEPITGSYLVEMSVVEPAGKQDKVGFEMKQFADCLKPLVYMNKADQFRPA